MGRKFQMPLFDGEPVKRQSKRRKCSICGRRTYYYLYDGFELYLGLSKAEARRCVKCAE